MSEYSRSPMDQYPPRQRDEADEVFDEVTQEVAAEEAHQAKLNKLGEQDAALEKQVIQQTQESDEAARAKYAKDEKMRADLEKKAASLEEAAIHQTQKTIEAIRTKARTYDSLNAEEMKQYKRLKPEFQKIFLSFDENDMRDYMEADDDMKRRIITGYEEYTKDVSDMTPEERARFEAEGKKLSEALAKTKKKLPEGLVDVTEYAEEIPSDEEEEKRTA